jgi:hypothetical protein
MLRHVALVRTDVSEELNESVISVTRIGEPGTTLAVTSNLKSYTLLYLRVSANKMSQFSHVSQFYSKISFLRIQASLCHKLAKFCFFPAFQIISYFWTDVPCMWNEPIHSVNTQPKHRMQHQTSIVCIHVNVSRRWCRVGTACHLLLVPGAMLRSLQLYIINASYLAKPMSRLNVPNDGLVTH